ncbi:MAG: hypothetical protein ACK4OM_02225 [Alphaproteobacteria bacterium]
MCKEYIFRGCIRGEWTDTITDRISQKNQYKVILNIYKDMINKLRPILDEEKYKNSSETIVSFEEVNDLINNTYVTDERKFKDSYRPIFKNGIENGVTEFINDYDNKISLQEYNTLLNEFNKKYEQAFKTMKNYHNSIEELSRKQNLDMADLIKELNEMKVNSCINR